MLTFKIKKDVEHGWGQQILCPICGYDYIHFEHPEYKDGKDNYIAWVGRGDAIEIPMSCENGHKWTTYIGFHKGNSYIGTKHFRTEDWIDETQIDQSKF